MKRFASAAALAACLASLAYGVAQILQLLGWVGDPLDRVLIFAPSLALAPCFVLALAGAAAEAPPQARAMRLGALGLGCLYATLVSAVYVIQLAAVIPGELVQSAEGVKIFACCRLGAPLTGVDLLGYTYMALALLVLAPTYPRSVLRALLIANGLLAPVILMQVVWPWLIYPAAAWLLLFPAAMALLARAGGKTGR